MKKLMIVGALAAIGFVSATQAASTGTITFNGKLTATTCDANVDNQGSDATITLPTIGTNQLTAAGNTAGRTGFNIALTNCAGSLSNAAAFFEAGSTVDLSTGRLKNVGGDATNVSLQLREATGTESVIKAGSTTQLSSSFYDISSGSANLPYSVEYYADGATTAGAVNSSVVYSIQYN